MLRHWNDTGLFRVYRTLSALDEYAVFLPYADSIWPLSWKMNAAALGHRLCAGLGVDPAEHLITPEPEGGIVMTHPLLPDHVTPR